MQPASDDPFAEIERAAQRQADEELAGKAIAAARSRLILSTDARGVFFASLALRLGVEMDWETETMSVDGKTMRVNPEFVKTLTPDETLGVCVHETLHVAMGHQSRRMGREPKRYNEACDLAINQIIEQASFKLPKCRLMVGEGKYKDFPKEKSAEEYYTLLQEQEPPQNEENKENGDGSGKGRPSSDPGGCGEVTEPGDQSDNAASEAEWKVAVAQAEQASRSRGTLPGGLGRAVQQVINPPADWRDVLREFVSKKAKNGYSWNRQNRRFVAKGLYLPGRFSRKLGKVTIAVDTSGSVGQRELAIFANEVEAIVGAYDCTAQILYHDSAITKTQEWEPSDGPLKLEPVGGGGTSHIPVFAEIENDEDPPACVICLTDLYTAFPAKPCEIPTLWAVIGGNQSPPPFGQTIHIK